MNTVSVTISSVSAATHALPQRLASRPEDMPPANMGLDNDPLTFSWAVTNSSGGPINLTVANLKSLLEGLILTRTWRGGPVGTPLLARIPAKTIRPFDNFLGQETPGEPGRLGLDLAVVAVPDGASTLSLTMRFPLVALPRMGRPMKGWRSHPGVLLLIDWSFQRLSEPTIADIAFGNLTISQTPVPLPARRLLFGCPPQYVNLTGDRTAIDGSPGLVIAARALVTPSSVDNVIVRAGDFTIIDQLPLDSVTSDMFPSFADFTDEADLATGALIFAVSHEPTPDDMILGPLRVSQSGPSQAPAVGLEQYLIPALPAGQMDAHAAAFRKVMIDAQGPWALNGQQLSLSPLSAQGLGGYGAAKRLSMVEPFAVVVGASADEVHTPVNADGLGPTVLPSAVRSGITRLSAPDQAAVIAQARPGGFEVATGKPLNLRDDVV